MSATVFEPHDPSMYTLSMKIVLKMQIFRRMTNVSWLIIIASDEHVCLIKKNIFKMYKKNNKEKFSMEFSFKSYTKTKIFP